MLKDKITIFVFSYNRHDYVRRVLDYYKNDDIQIIVTDDSKETLPDVDKYPNLKYVQSGLPYQQSVRDPLNEHVKTPYTMLCADDILIPVSAIEKCIEFLEENPDYITAQGYQASMYHSDNGYYFKMGSQLPIDAGSDSAADRMLKLMTTPPQYWGVFRSDAVKEIFNNLSLEILNEPRGTVCEVMIYMSTGCVGKHKRLPMFYALHEDVPSVGVERRRGFSHWEMINHEKHRKDYENFVKEGAKMLMKYEDISYDEAALYAQRSLELYAVAQRDEVGHKTIAYRIKRELRSVWRKTGGKEAYQAEKNARAEAFEAQNNARLDAMDPESRARLDKVAEFVYKYPRCRENNQQ